MVNKNRKNGLSNSDQMLAKAVLTVWATKTVQIKSVSCTTFEQSEKNQQKQKIKQNVNSLQLLVTLLVTFNATVPDYGKPAGVRFNTLWLWHNQYMH